jgi:hypothetical protein
MLDGKEPVMQPQPTSVFIHADAYRQELLADFERGRPKVRRERTRQLEEPSSMESSGEYQASSSDERPVGRMFVAFRVVSAVAVRFVRSASAPT